MRALPLALALACIPAGVVASLVDAISAAPPSGPRAPWPANGAEEVDTWPLLLWEDDLRIDGVTTYDVVINLTSIPWWEPWRVCMDATDLRCGPFPVGWDTDAAWRVEAHEPSGTRVSPTWTFSTGHPTALPTAQNPWPPNQAVGQATSGPLRWTGESEPHTDWYVDLSLDPTFDVPAERICTQIKPHECERSAQGTLAPATTYYWRASSADGFGANPGPTWWFRTAAAG